MIPTRPRFSGSRRAGLHHSPDAPIGGIAGLAIQGRNCDSSPTPTPTPGLVWSFAPTFPSPPTGRQPSHREHLFPLEIALPSQQRQQHQHQLQHQLQHQHPLSPSPLHSFLSLVPPPFLLPFLSGLWLVIANRCHDERCSDGDWESLSEAE